MSETKVTDEQFLGALTQASGIFARTAEIIEELYEVKYSRQAVRDRALKHPKTLDKIRIDTVIIAEDTHRDLMLNSNSDAIKRGCSEYLLDRIGKDKGYTPKQEFDTVMQVEHTGKVATYHLPDNGRGKPATAAEDLKAGTITPEEAKAETDES